MLFLSDIFCLLLLFYVLSLRWFIFCRRLKLNFVNTILIKYNMESSVFDTSLIRQHWRNWIYHASLFPLPFLLPSINEFSWLHRHCLGCLRHCPTWSPSLVHPSLILLSHLFHHSKFLSVIQSEPLNLIHIVCTKQEVLSCFSISQHQNYFFYLDLTSFGFSNLNFSDIKIL